MKYMQKVLILITFIVPVIASAQSNCFTSCIPYQQNNPSAGQNCTTTCSGGNDGGGSLMDAYRKGYESTRSVEQDIERKKMINRAKDDCNNGIQAGCEWLRRNNIY